MCAIVNMFVVLLSWVLSHFLLGVYMFVTVLLLHLCPLLLVVGYYGVVGVAVICVDNVAVFVVVGVVADVGIGVRVVDMCGVGVYCDIIVVVVVAFVVEVGANVVTCSR